MRMLVSVEIADAGTKTGPHRVLVLGGCSDTTAPGDIGISLEEAKTLLSALQWEYVAAQAAESRRSSPAHRIACRTLPAANCGIMRAVSAADIEVPWARMPA